MFVPWPALLGAPEYACVRMSPARRRIQDLGHQLAALHAADVAHHLAARAGRLAGEDRALERLQAMLVDHVLGHAHLDAEHHVGVFRHRFRGNLGIRIADVEELRHRKAGEPDVGDVHEGIHPGAGLRRDVAPENREVVRARVAGGDHGGGGLVGHELVGGDADRRAVGEHVRMQVDEAGRYQLAARVEHAQRALRRDVGLQRFNHSEADSDVPPRAQLLARVQHLAAFDDQVELVVRPHRRLHGPDHQPG